MTLQQQIEILRRRIAMRKETNRSTFKLEARLTALVTAQLIAENEAFKPRIRVPAGSSKAVTR